MRSSTILRRRTARAKVKGAYKQAITNGLRCVVSGPALSS